MHCRAGSVGRLPSKDQNVVVNFILGFERYFCEGRMRIESGVANIDMKKNLYVLQRRKSVRMNIPDKYPASFNCILGIQFELQNKTFETKLLTIFMDLHRELFVKYG